MIIDQTRNAIDSSIVEDTMTAEMIRRHSYDCVRDNRHTFPMPIVETHGTLLCFIDVPGLRWLRGEPLGIGNSGRELEVRITRPVGWQRLNWPVGRAMAREEIEPVEI
jgi:hypothetical protein